MSTREELIEKAAMAIAPWAWGTNLSTKTSQAEARRDAEAAFKVFEQARTPGPADDGDQGPAAGCAYCVGAGGYEDYDGEWAECSCQNRPVEAARRAEPSGYRAILVQQARALVDHWRAYDDTEELVGTLVGMANILAEDAPQSAEPGWEYGSEGAESTDDPNPNPDPRPLTDDKRSWPAGLDDVQEPNAQQAAQIVAAWNVNDPNSARLIRRRKAGPWGPAPVAAEEAVA